MHFHYSTIQIRFFKSKKIRDHHKKDSVKLVSLSSNCGIQAKIQQSPLVIDTSKIGDRYMVNVGTEFWVISEKTASLMSEWEITGYTLKEVIHKFQQIF